ncbi:MAG: flagellar filament capping protein FliD [bacterium]|nr:flagellar filament capping protein FliD [bacterium]
MNNIAFSGLASGLDTGAIVSQLVELKRAPIYRLQNRKQGFQAQLSSLVKLKTKLTDMQSAMQDLDTANEFSSLKATSSDEDFLTVTPGSDAAAGSYTFEILNLAKAQKTISQGFDSVEESIGSGIVSFNVGGTTTDINLTGFNSLESLKNLINNDVAGVTASIINDGSESGNYTLVLSGEEAGSDNSFTVDVSGLSGGTTPLFTTAAENVATDATIEIDGQTVTVGSNSSDEVISGLTINLLQAEVGKEVTVNVTVDTEGISEKVKTFVDKYNDLFTYIKEQGGEEGELRQNPTLRAVASRIERIATSALDEGLGSITNFHQVGISRGDGRTLNFDSSDFADALNDDFNGVRDFFIEREGNLGKSYLFDQAVESMTDSIDGLFKISNDALNKKIEYADDGIDRYERSVESYRKTMERKFTAMEMMMAQLQAQGSYLAGITQ